MRFAVDTRGNPGRSRVGCACTYPAKPVRLVVPFTPGGSSDIVARLLTQKLVDFWGQQFVIDNRPGAGGAVGAEMVARAAPDGYTIMLTNPGPGLHNALLRKKPPYTLADFAPIVYIGYTPNLIAAYPRLPVNNLKELVDYARANPGKINWASPARGQQSAHRARDAENSDRYQRGSQNLQKRYAGFHGSGGGPGRCAGPRSSLPRTTLNRGASRCWVFLNEAAARAARNGDVHGAGRERRRLDAVGRLRDGGEDAAGTDRQVECRSEQGAADAGRYAAASSSSASRSKGVRRRNSAHSYGARPNASLRWSKRERCRSSNPCNRPQGRQS